MLRDALGTSSGPSLCHVLPGLLLAGKLMQLSLVSTVLEKQQKAKETKLAFLAVLYGGASYEEKGKKKKGSQSCFKHLLLQVHHRMISDVSKLFQTAILFKIFASRDLISSWAKQLVTCDVQVVLVHLLIFACVSWDLPKAEAAGSPGPGGVWSGVGEEPGEQGLPDFQEGSPKLEIPKTFVWMEQ